MPRKLPLKIYTLDTETIGLDGDIRRIAIYDGKEVIYGYEFSDVEYLLIEASKKFRVHIYIHNLEFDVRKISEIFNSENIVWGQTILISGKFAKITTINYVLHDSFKLLPESLSELSKSFDLEHGKLDLWEEVEKVYPGKYKDHVDFLARCPVDNGLYLKYLGYDVISLYELLYKLMEVSGITEDDFVKILTTASMSRWIFKNGYKGKKFQGPDNKKSDFEMLCSCVAWRSEKPIRKSDTQISYKQVESIIRDAYHGGRAEVFKMRLEGDGYHYDVNSEYPAMMEKYEFPVGYPEYYEKEFTVKYLFEKWLQDHTGLGFLDCEVFIPYTHIPPLPVAKGKLTFPCGYMEGVFTFIELEYAIKYYGAKIIAYNKLILFPKTYPVFRNFIQTFAPMKSEAKATGQKALEKFCKLVQNVGYGYTGMRRDDKTELKSNKDIDKYSERLLWENKEFGFIEIKSNVMANYIQVQVAAYVTSYARILWLDAARVQSEKGEVYYGDTDSLVTSVPLPEDMVHATQLGMWDLEKELIDAVFLQPKVYIEKVTEEYVKKDGKAVSVKYKGISKAKQKELDFAFYNMLYQELQEQHLDKIEIEEKQILKSIKAAWRSGKNPNQLVDAPRSMILGNKQKRIMDYANNKTYPYFFETIEDFRTFSYTKDYSHLMNEKGTLLDFSKGGLKV